MTVLHETIETPLAIGPAFDYVADFANAQEWDPGVITAERLTVGAIAEGAEFRLVARFLGSTSVLTYRIVEYDPPHAVTFHGENDAVVSHDRITVVPESGGTTIDYDAQLELKGYRKLMEPLVSVAFRRVGARALGGLRQVLTERALDGATQPTGR